MPCSSLSNSQEKKYKWRKRVKEREIKNVHTQEHKNHKAHPQGGGIWAECDGLDVVWYPRAHVSAVGLDPNVMVLRGSETFMS